MLNLREMIENYIPFNEQEIKDKEIFLKYIDTFDDVLSRKNEFAHFTSSAFVLNEKKDKVLMIHHNIYKSWAWTGGHADEEEDLLGVAIREVKEETGVNAHPITEQMFNIDTIPVLGHMKNGKYVPAHIHLSAGYLCIASEDEKLIIKEDENSGIKWVPINNVADMTSETYMKSVYNKMIEKINTMELS